MELIAMFPCPQPVAPAECTTVYLSVGNRLRVKRYHPALVGFIALTLDELCMGSGGSPASVNGIVI